MGEVRSNVKHPIAQAIMQELEGKKRMPVFKHNHDDDIEERSVVFDD